MFRMDFTPWGRLRASVDEAAHMAFMQGVGRNAHAHFRAGMEASRGGRLYTHELRTIGGRVVPVGARSKPHRASAPGAYPAVDTGRLKGSIRTTASRAEAKIGTSRHYAIYLRKGTSRMARRKMSDDALKETLSSTWARKKPFARLDRV